MKVQQFLESIHLKRNTNYRGNCPNCGGSNTFSVSNVDGKIKYFCFRNSCSLKGIKDTVMSMEDIKDKYKPTEEKPLLLKDCTGWTGNIKLYPKVIEYLYKNNCLDAFEQYPHRFFYDKVKDRIVFVEYCGLNGFVLATGRSLDGASPKWFKYVAMQGEYFIAECIDGKAAAHPTVIVEDCASACSVSRVANGLALCGTNYNISALLKKLHDIKDIIVCLDPDAQLKTMKLQRDLIGAGKFRSVGVLRIKDDLKYLSDKNKLFELIYGKK